jgi:hypothetical protein
MDGPALSRPPRNHLETLDLSIRSTSFLSPSPDRDPASPPVRGLLSITVEIRINKVR